MPKCKHCKKDFERKRINQIVCSYECSISYSKELAIRRKIKEEQKKEKINKEFKAVEIKDKEEKKLKASKINTKTQVHSYIRERDKGKPCISCGTSWNSDFQAGHHYKSETFITLRYNLDNIHGQCKRCNLHLEGAFDNYALNLPNRIGIERYNKLVELASIDKQFEKVWNLENLKEVRMLLKQNKSYEVKK